MKLRLKGFLVAVLILLPMSGWCCEPILPLAQLLGGSSALGPLMWKQSFLWLAAAVVVKSVAFAVFEKRMRWHHALGIMLLANLLSTVPGLLLAVLAGSMSASLLAIPLVYLFGVLISRHVSPILSIGKKPWFQAGPLAMAFTVFYVLSVAFYIGAQEILIARSYAYYWLLQFTFIVLVASMGIVISSALEEYAIGRLSAKRYPNQFFYAPVIRANYITLALILLVAAIQMLPARLRSPHFLVFYLDEAWNSARALIL